ncbi:hypothetical protein K9O30_06130 [Clostridium bowmanii]|uniref:hypothetical protein n=1 Tax=Clostridium bowmanii TaxID=132925 RepID=UPI001C0D7120|nr:hypothetical protein [Clostridium bowmanii]MBU3188738.1 hypothetical protein [Clostridium bowmanii]MCA1073323.1 hypothetical protein [Clostridium bowmanii]
MEVKNAYKNYFDIDENYFPSVSDELLAGGFVDWNSFYPHATFIELLKNTASILRRQQKLSIWVEGAYGTGKSHAVLTLKHILDAPETEVEKYFVEHNLEMDLFNIIQGAKAQGKILTIHRVGSSGIKGDNSLIMAIQESIKEELLKKDIEYKCEESLKDAIIKKLGDPVFARFFNDLIVSRYKLEFGADNAESIIHKLSTYSENDVADLIRKIFMVAEKEDISAIKLDTKDLGKWINDIIERNKLKSIIFIWDEFTEYFTQNKNSITGFQTLAELSATIPFHFIIVTHKSGGLFNDKDNDRKIVDRFITCNITLPENMAFKLMGNAMKKKEIAKNDWKNIADDLYEGVPSSSNMVIKSAKIDEDDLKGILPIHPYTAIILKHLSSMFGSNQRSMFDFIKNRKDDETDRSFQWFIENYGPDSDPNLLTIDMLWEYFYENGKVNLESAIKNLLSVFEMGGNNDQLNDDRKRVLKTVLLLQGISEKTGDKVGLFRPIAKNIGNAYEGTDIGSLNAVQIAERLVKEGRLFKQQIGNNEYQFVAMRSGSNEVDVSKKIEKLRETKKLKDIIENYNVAEFMGFNGALKLRFETNLATIENISQISGKIRNKYYQNTIPVVIVFAKDDTESAAVIGRIRELVKSNEQEIIFIDNSLCDLTDEKFEEYIKNVAECDYWMGPDKGQAKKYDEMAKEVIERWKESLLTAEIRVITKNQEQKAFGVTEVFNKLREINTERFPDCIENFSVVGTMFDANAFKSGSICGITQTVKFQYRSSNEATKLENVLKGVWLVDDYVNKNKHHLISRIKNNLEGFMADSFDKKGKVSIKSIYDHFKITPWGFLPCNLTAFILGFLLKEYANDTYSWSNEQVSEVMSVDKMAEMIDEIIKLQTTPSNRYLDKYIVKMSSEEKAFLKGTATIFKISESACATIDKTRNEIRAKIKTLGFPLWAIGLQLDVLQPIGYVDMKEIVESYCDFTNNGKSGKRDVDIVTYIGKTFTQNDQIVIYLKELVTFENCRMGMVLYLDKYNSGELKELADKINDGGYYINALKSKMNDASSWLWHVDTINAEIDKLILEYKIVDISNKYITRTTSYKEMVDAWVDKMQFFKLPFDGVKNDLGNLKELFECLYEIKISGDISDFNKLKFLCSLQNYGDDFAVFFNNQVTLFKKKCEFELFNLSDEAIAKIFNEISLGSFTKSNSEYKTSAGKIIDHYNKSLKINELHKLWISKTGSSSPIEWSKKNRTPILCLADKDFEIVKRTFDTLNRKASTDAEIKSALEYLNSSDIFERLNDEKLRNEAFKNKILGENVILISDIEQAKNILSERMMCEEYEWYPNPRAIEFLNQYAEKLYLTTEFEKALTKIEAMDDATLKNYLKILVRENVKVGMEIMKDK